MSEKQAVTPTDIEESVANMADANVPDPDSTTTDEDNNVWSIRDQKRRRRIKIIAIAAVLAIVLIAVVMIVNRFRGPMEESEAALDPVIAFAQACQELADNPELTTLHVRDFKIDDQLIGKIKPLTSIEIFIVDQGVLTDPSIQTIAALPQLRQLRLRLSPITDAGLGEITKCKTLQFLNLPHAECGIVGVEKLQELPNLRQLRLGSKKLTGEVAKTIAKMTQLRTLHLIGVPITDEGLKVIARMPQLESLYLDDSAVTDAGWNWVFANKAHLHVHIDQRHHDRDPGRHEHK